MRRARRLVGRAAFACALVVFAAPGTASGAVGFEVIPGQSNVSFPGTAELTYTLKMTTDAEGTERFSIRAGGGSFGAPDSGPQGSALSGPGDPLLSGAGTIDGFGRAIPALAACSMRGPGYHGLHDGGLFTYVTLPPSTQTNLTFTFRRASQAPWPSTTYTPVFIAWPDAWLVPDTLGSPVSIPVPEPLVTGISGVEIRFKTKPRSAGLPVLLDNPPAEIRKGRKIKIVGNTDPTLRRQKLRLMQAGPGDKKPKLLAKVRTRKNGKFRYKGWEPDKKGEYELWVEYRSQRDHLASDFTCSRMFELVPGKKGK